MTPVNLQQTPLDTQADQAINAPDGCMLCPRRCGARRTPEDPGWCGSDEGFEDVRVASWMPHFGEEALLSGRRGSGTVFFSGCSLGCCFCQNHTISLAGQGKRMSTQELVEAVMALHLTGVHNLNLVTPSHYADRLHRFFSLLHLTRRWQHQPLPVIWNSSAYETVSSLRALHAYLDVYLVDMKFLDSQLADDCTQAPDYPDVSFQALAEMIRQQPRPMINSQGLIQKGVIIRHLVLPGCWQDSCHLIDRLTQIVPRDTPLHIMDQYTPRLGNPCPRQPQLQRRLSHSDYQRVFQHAVRAGFTQLIHP